MEHKFVPKSYPDQSMVLQEVMGMTNVSLFYSRNITQVVTNIMTNYVLKLEAHRPRCSVGLLCTLEDPEYPKLAVCPVCRI